MDNCTCRVDCNVCECLHNDCVGNKCKLDCIEISHDKTQENAVSCPHFCKSFTKR